MIRNQSPFATAARCKVLVALVGLLSACSHPGPPYKPDQAIKTIKIDKGFHLELFASEPMVASPVAMEFDENGRIFVVEMPGYPLDTRPTGRVKLLEDTDGDGRPDRAQVFADGLVLPTGVMRWKKGILVTAAPDVWYLEDTDGDGRADLRKVVLTGFAFTNPQHTVNSPLYGLDNWIYLAHEGPAEAIVFKEKFGDTGSDIRFPDRKDLPGLSVGRRSVRFRPDTHQLEALSGASQFGHAFDEWGHYFTVNNSNNGRHEVIAARYLRRNPDLLVRTAMQDMSDHENAAQVFPITQHPEIQLLTEAGTLTSACSLTLYLGGAFPAGFARISFVAEPAQNLVHADRWLENGSSFVMKRLSEESEFLASTDNWFRPVNMTIGPDGAVYLVDYYRRLIEHPEWTSTQHHHDSKELYQGSDRGRIYRIVPDSPSPFPLPRNVRLGAPPSKELVEQLSHPNIWWRRTAQRLLADRHQPETVEMLERLFRDNSSPMARVHALWTLDALGKLDSQLIEQASRDREPGVRENAIRLAESRLADSPQLVERLLQMADDANPKVRFQLLCTLGFIDSARAQAAQQRLLLENIEDPWMQVAALSASSNRAFPFFELAVSSKTDLAAKPSPGRIAFFRQVCAVLGARHNTREIDRLLTILTTARTGSEWWSAASLEGLAQGIRAKKHGTTSERVQVLLLRLFGSRPAPVRRASLELLKLVGLPPIPQASRSLARAHESATSQNADADARADAISLLALSKPESQLSLCERLVDPREPEVVQAAAVKTLGVIPGAEVGKFLLSKWRTLSAPVRSEAADALLADPARTRQLLDAIQREDVQTWTLNFGQKRDLIMNDDPEVRKIAHQLLEDKPGAREQVLKRYEAALDRSADTVRGEQVFKRVCAKCHRKNGVGAEVGPDLGTVRNRPASLILEDILMPSKSIAQKYEAYVVERVSGGTEDGVMAMQTSTTITLRKEEGKDLVIPRQDIKRMYVANLSAMPADVEKQVDVQQMADLLAFLTSKP